MGTPTLADYVDWLFTLFERLWQHDAAQSHRGRPFVYQHKALSVFFLLMQQRRTFRFKAQHRWLHQHPDWCQVCGLPEGPDRTTLSRRDQDLYPVFQDFIAFVGQYAEDLAPQCTRQDRYADQSLFKAQGPVWPQSARQAGRMPDTLRHLDTDGSWSKSGYHGWVDGDGRHVVDNRVGLPKWVQVETAAVAESDVIDQQAGPLMQPFHPHTVSTDNRDAKARRIRPWAKQGVGLLSPAVQWDKGRSATASHRSIQQPENAALLRRRRPALEPVCD